MDDCIFCRIVKEELPCTRVYEDDLALAFMDIAPVVRGHVLVIPREHYDPLYAVPERLLQHLIGVVSRVARGQMTGLQANGVNIMQANGAVAGQVVPHVHFHVIPRFHDDGHSWNWRAGKYDNPDEAHGLARKIHEAIVFTQNTSS
ncbi:MAG: HIT family protein [Kiritimatiellia bacterium]|nr:HIT family protein [Lentisphaerota bacterium]